MPQDELAPIISEKKYNYYKKFYSDEFFEYLCKELQITAEEGIDNLKYTLSKASADYQDMKEAHDKFYAPQSELKKPLTKFKSSLNKASEDFEELMSDQNYWVLYKVMQKACENKGTAGLDEDSKKFVDQFFSEYEWLYGGKDDCDDTKNYKEGPDSAHYYDMRGPYQKLSGLIKYLKHISELVTNEEIYSPPSKTSALDCWIRNIGRTWKARSPVSFTVGPHYEGHGYNSKAYHLIQEMLKPIDPRITPQEIATALRKNSKESK